MELETLNRTQVIALIDAHVRLYTNRVHAAEQGQRGVNLNECEMYLAIWQDAYDVVMRVDGWPVDWWTYFAPKELVEIRDAVACGDYDELLARSATESGSDPPKEAS
jgi:hypothetical protein